jgi:hypothetical protein
LKLTTKKNKKNIHNTQTKKKRLQFPQGTLPFFLPLDSRLLSTKIPHNRLQQKRKRHKDFETGNQKNKKNIHNTQTKKKKDCNSCKEPFLSSFLSILARTRKDPPRTNRRAPHKDSATDKTKKSRNPPSSFVA